MLLNKAPPSSEAYSHECFLLALPSAGGQGFSRWGLGPTGRGSQLGWFRCSGASQPPGFSGMCPSHGRSRGTGTQPHCISTVKASARITDSVPRSGSPSQARRQEGGGYTLPLLRRTAGSCGRGRVDGERRQGLGSSPQLISASVSSGDRCAGGLPLTDLPRLSRPPGCRLTGLQREPLLGGRGHSYHLSVCSFLVGKLLRAPDRNSSVTSEQGARARGVAG